MTIALFEKFTSKPIEVADMPPMVVVEPSLVDRVTAAIEAVVKEAGPGYRYQGRYDPDSGGAFPCYTWRGEPDCIVGRVLHKMGVPVSVLATYEHESAWHIVTGLLRGPDVERVARALKVAQQANDHSLPWGDALTVYHRALNQ